MNLSAHSAVTASCRKWKCCKRSQNKLLKPKSSTTPLIKVVIWWIYEAKSDETRSRITLVNSVSLGSQNMFIVAVVLFLTDQTCLPSRTCGPAANTVSTQLGSLKLTKPNPRDFPVVGFMTTTQSSTSPNRLKYWSSDADRQYTSAIFDLLIN